MAPKCFASDAMLTSLGIFRAVLLFDLSRSSQNAERLYHQDVFIEYHLFLNIKKHSGSVGDQNIRTSQGGTITKMNQR